MDAMHKMFDLSGHLIVKIFNSKSLPEVPEDLWTVLLKFKMAWKILSVRYRRIILKLHQNPSFHIHLKPKCCFDVAVLLLQKKLPISLLSFTITTIINLNEGKHVPAYKFKFTCRHSEHSAMKIRVK